MNFICEYCKKDFKFEASIAKHMCKEKYRFMQRDVQHVKLGFKLFNDWYKRAMGAKKNKTYEQFIASRYYAAFVRFSSYILDARVHAPERYLEWLIVNQIAVDRWNKDSVYNLYLTDENKKETPERAVERYVLHAQSWSEKTGNHWSEYWKQAGINTILHDIKMGKISPWILLSYTPAKNILTNMPNEMLNEVANTLDLTYWNRKIDVNKPTVKWIEEILQ